MEIRFASVEYIEAYNELCKAHNAGPDSKGTFGEMIDAFLSSSEFKALGARTQKDHRRNILHQDGIAAEFGSAPIKAFEDKRIRREVFAWRDTFSVGTGDNMMATMQRLVSFGYDRGYVGEHHLMKLKKRKKANRAHIVWTAEEVNKFVAGVPLHVARILIVAVETGCRPGDLHNLTRAHIEQGGGPHGRILFRTQKSRQQTYAAVPVTPRLAKLISELPAEQMHLIVGERGAPYKNAQKLGQLVSKWRDELGIRKDLRLYDARGTAVTRLLRAGCSLSELAIHMGWSVQHASAMVERYAALDPSMSDGIFEKMEAASKAQGR